MIARTLYRALWRVGCKAPMALPLSSRLLHRSAPLLSDALPQHRDTKENTAETKFDFTAEEYKEVDIILAKYPDTYKQSAIMPLLYLAQEQGTKGGECDAGQNLVSLSAMNKIAELLEVPPMRVYEVATFYTMYNRTEVGKYHIQLCGTTPCLIMGADKIKSAITEELGIKEGETTEDGMFTLTEVECLGACVNAPMIQINNHEFFEHLTPDNMKQLIRDWKAGKEVKEGNQNHIKTCEGPQGKTTLKTQLPDKPPCRDLDALKAELAAAKADADK